MSYNEYTWQTGETITAEKLNNLEEGVQEALEGGGGDAGYECTETKETVFEGSLTTTDGGGGASARFTLTQPLAGNAVFVTIDGEEYELPKADISIGLFYGELDSDEQPILTTYPCYVSSSSYGNFLGTKEEGTYSVKIANKEMSVETSECFEKAVNKVVALKNIADGMANLSLRGNNAYDNTTYPLGNAATAFGSATAATGEASFAEGSLTVASGIKAHAEGYQSNASGENSHAEGHATNASGENSHAEGWSAIASGENSHVEGHHTYAGGSNSHAEGLRTDASFRSQHVFGEYSDSDPSSAQPYERGTYVEIVGNGIDEYSRSNARTLDWSGNESLQGSLTLGKGTADETTITATQLKALIALLNS